MTRTAYPHCRAITVLDFRLQGAGSDATIAAGLGARWDQAEAGGEAADGESSLLLDGVDLALTDSFFGALTTFLLAIERGDRTLMEQSAARLREGLSVCSEINLIPQWWAHRVALHLLSDLWGSSFHERLPLLPTGGDAADWPSLRELFIASLSCRPKVEIDLWPSQIAAATRAVDQTDDLVVSLPASAGKTRISELCILRCLAAGRRVIFVTPLRALSAQTETTLQRTFGPLGKTISALYGSIGVSGFDEDAIRQHHIVVATPEKLDFALRNDPSLLDDVGLLVFDEGHMIGLSEREVRYEVQIQRLLRRALGVAIHHGALPTAFRKEVERLLRDGILKVTISSPTLAQGLNLSATTVIIHSLFRNRERIETSEFKNVIGRAGRAYVDVDVWCSTQCSTVR